MEIQYNTLYFRLSNADAFIQVTVFILNEESKLGYNISYNIKSKDSRH